MSGWPNRVRHARLQSRVANRTNGIRCPTARKSASDPSTENPISRGSRYVAAARCRDGVSGEDFRPFLRGERYRRHGDRVSSDLDADLRRVKNVAVPGGGGSPSAGDHEAFVGGIVLDDFQNDLALLAGDSPDVIEQQDALTEQPAQPQPIEVNRRAEQCPAHPRRWSHSSRSSSMPPHMRDAPERACPSTGEPPTTCLRHTRRAWGRCGPPGPGLTSDIQRTAARDHAVAFHATRIVA